MEEKNLQEELQDNSVTENMGEQLAEEQTSQPGKEDVKKLQSELQELKDKYLRQVAEFDNFRKRTARERLDYMQTAGREVIESLLEVLDDSERAEKQFNSSQDLEALRQGVSLVFNKFRNTLQSKGLKAMNSIGEPFDPEMHEAITEIPAASEEMKGKVVDVIEKGYYLNDKIIRYAKVVVGK